MISFPIYNVLSSVVNCTFFIILKFGNYPFSHLLFPFVPMFLIYPLNMFNYYTLQFLN